MLIKFSIETIYLLIRNRLFPWKPERLENILIEFTKTNN